MALPSSKPAGSDFPPIMIIIKGGHRRGGAGGYIHVGSLRRREARSSGRADQDGGGGAPRADPAAEQPLAPRRNSSEISLASGRRRPGNRKRFAGRLLQAACPAETLAFPSNHSVAPRCASHQTRRAASPKRGTSLRKLRRRSRVSRLAHALAQRRRETPCLCLDRRSAADHCRSGAVFRLHLRPSPNAPTLAARAPDTLRAGPQGLSGDRGSKPSPQLASHPARFVSFSHPPRAAPLRALRPIHSPLRSPRRAERHQHFQCERLFIFISYDMVGEVKKPCYRLFLCAK